MKHWISVCAKVSEPPAALVKSSRWNTFGCLINQISRPIKWDILRKRVGQHRLKYRGNQPNHRSAKVYLHRSTMPRGKEISEDIRKKAPTAHQSGESYKTISKRFLLQPSTVRQIIYKWRAFNMTATLTRRSGRPSKLSPISTRKIINQVKANSHITSRELQTSLAASRINVHASTIRRKLKRHDIHGRVARKKPLLSRKNKAARFNFAREHLDKPKAFWKSILWTDESKIELFGHNQNCHVWRKANTAYQEKNLLQTVKQSGGNVKVWGSFSASGPGQLYIIQGNINSHAYRQILDQNLLPSVRELKLGRKWVLQQDNDPKHTSKTIKEWLKRKRTLYSGLA